MANPSKRKGTDFESAVCAALRVSGFPNAERRALAGNLDLGDIVNAGPYVWECKNQRALSLAEWVDETDQETRNAGAEFGFLIVKRRMRPAEKAYAVLPLEKLCKLLERI